jgi:hypothetical protein
MMPMDLAKGIESDSGGVGTPGLTISGNQVPSDQTHSGSELARDVT